MSTRVFARAVLAIGLLVSFGCRGGDELARNLARPMADFTVRVHRAGGGPGGMNWTNTVRSNGEVENFGGEFLSCQPGVSSLVQRGTEAEPARGRVPEKDTDALRELLSSEAFARARGIDKVTSPAYDGVGGEVTVEAGGATRRLKFDFVAKQQEPVLDHVIAEVRRLVTNAGLDASCAPVAWGSVDAKGALTAAEARPKLTLLLPQIGACYEGALAQTPDRRGFMAVSIVVAADGSVPSVGFDNSVNVAGDTRFEGCLTKLLRGTVFPASRAQTELTAVLSFSPPPR